MSDTRSFMALDWVREEIEGTLKQAQEALEAYVESDGDSTLARQCLTRLHQVHGTLQMVELEGASEFAAELEALAQAMLDGAVGEPAVAHEVLMEGVLQLPAHLDRVQRGAPDDVAPYRSLLNRMRVARGEQPEAGPASAVDPDAVRDFLASEGPQTVRTLRANYQKGMLALIRKAQPPARLWPFFDRIFTQLEAVTPTSPLARLWGLSAGVMERQSGDADAATVLPILRALDTELRSLAKDPEAALAGSPAEELVAGLRDRLEPEEEGDSARVIALRKQWTAPADDEAEYDLGADDATIATVAAALHEELAGIRDQLDLFARGSIRDPAALAGLGDVLQRVAGTLSVIGRDDLRERIQGQLERVTALERGDAVGEDAVMDVAGAVLEVDGRLMGLAGLESEDGEEIPGTLSEAHAAVLREVRSSLDGVKQSINDFISSEWEHAHLSPIAGTLAAVRSVLGLIPLERAADLIECCRLYLQNEILADQVVPEWQRLDTLADAITSIDYYLERMLEDRSIPDPKLLDIAEESVTALGYPISALAAGEPTLPVMQVDDDEPEAAATQAEPEAFAEAEGEAPPAEPFAIEASAEAAPVERADSADDAPSALSEAVESDFDLGLGEEEAPAVQGAPADDAPSALSEPVESDFDLGLDEEEAPAVQGAPADDAPSALSEPVESDFDLGSGESDFVLGGGDAPEPVPQAAGGEADEGLIDDEIIEIFLEEVDEVLEGLDTHLPEWRADPEPGDALTEIRRAFHTLKGSGRMVGATVLGELAWSVENMLNRVIDRTITASPPVVQLVEQSRAMVSQLRQAFADGAEPDPDVQRLMENADVLASGGSEEDLQDDEPAAEAAIAGPTESDFTLDDDFQEALPPSEEPAPPEPELLEVFDQEAVELLATLREYLAEHARTGSAPPLVDSVRRALHTLKGSAAMADLERLSELAARLEHLVRGYLEIQRSADRPLLDVLTGGVERMEAMRAHLMSVGTEPAADETDAALLDTLATLTAEVDREIAVREGGEVPGATLAEIFRSDGMERVVDGIRVLDAWAAGTADARDRDVLATELAALGQRTRSAGEEAMADLASALGVALKLLPERPAKDAFDLLREAHERLMNQLDALAAGLEVPAGADLVQALSARIPIPEAAAETVLVDDTASLDLDPEMLDIFFEETDELLQEMEDWLASWPSADAREGMMRALHTLKGGARMAGLDGLGQRVHDTESWLGAADDADPAVLPRLQEAVDDLADRVARLRRGERVLVADEEPAGKVAPSSEQASEPPSEPGPASPLEADFDLGGLDTAAETGLAAPEPVAAEPAAPTADDAATTGVAAAAPPPASAAGPAEEGLADADPEILALFLEEALELTENLDATIAEWRQETGNELHLESLLRDLHTLKGGARMAGLAALGETAHELESTLIGVRGQTAGDDFLGEIQAAVDGLVGRVAALDPSRAPAPVAQPQPAEVPEPASAPADTPETPEAAAPAPAQPEPETPAAPAAKDAPLREAPQEMIRVAAGLLDDLVSLAGESSIMRGRIQQQVADFGHALEEMDATIERMRQQVRRLELETEAQVLFRQEKSEQEGYEDFDPLEMDRYTQLQELARTLAESASDVTDLRQTLVDRARDTDTLLLQQGRIHTELQEGLMRTRMVPFSRLLPRLQRIVRQVGRELGKPVKLEVRDAEGDLDRNILERMIPPLEHMLRNAVDHGIESAAERAERGKPAAGTITLRLAREAGEILVEVADDGGGIDAEVIRRKAIERGLLAEDATPGEEEVLAFIMTPGFSTASAVTQISGRGVGMDVVNSEVRQMGGGISIASTVGRGTRFTVRLPFTVSINRALMVTLGEDEYALPLNSIEGIVRVGPQQLKRQYESDAPGFSYAGRNYALSYLGAWLGLPAQVREDAPSLPVLMVRTGDRGHAVHVDAVAGSREIVVKSLGPQFAGVQGVSGATILGDGRVVVILDLPSLLRGGVEVSLTRGEDEPAPARQVERRRQVLVVDDSVTVRKVTTRLLERQGMEVTVAKDGVEAVSILQELKPDVMLLDIEMPRMDGFEVARHVRNEARLQDLPIIMITSRTGDKHRERAESLQVNRFLGKPFQEAELLASIEELAGQ